MQGPQGRIGATDRGSKTAARHEGPEKPQPRVCISDRVWCEATDGPEVGLTALAFTPQSSHLSVAPPSPETSGLIPTNETQRKGCQRELPGNLTFHFKRMQGEKKVFSLLLGVLGWGQLGAVLRFEAPYQGLLRDPWEAQESTHARKSRILLFNFY